MLPPFYWGNNSTTIRIHQFLREIKTQSQVFLCSEHTRGFRRRKLSAYQNTLPGAAGHSLDASKVRTLFGIQIGFRRQLLLHCASNILAHPLLIGLAIWQAMKFSASLIPETILAKSSISCAKPSAHQSMRSVTSKILQSTIDMIAFSIYYEITFTFHLSVNVGRVFI
jgi:hypothetical protein